MIVPNIYEGAKNEVILDWVRSQARRGATIVGICDGRPVLANAGFLEGRRATGHWKTIDRLERRHPGTLHHERRLRFDVSSWSPVHDSSRFSLRGKLATGLLNKMLIWRHESLGIRVAGAGR